MADKVTFTMEAEVAQVVRANEQVVASEKKVEQQFTQTARTADQANRQIEQSTRRTAATVAGAVEEYGLAPLNATAGAGAAVRFRASGSATRRPRAFSLAPVAVQSAAAQLMIERSTAEPYEVRNRDERMQRAQMLRDDRAFAREVAAIDARNTQVGGRNLAGMAWLLGSAQRGMARADERYNARLSAEATSALNAGTIAYAAAGGAIGLDDDRAMRVARRRVAANVMNTPELQGKVSDQEFEVMSRTMARKLSETETASRRLLSVAAIVAAAMGAAVMKIIAQLEESRRKLDDFAAGARGATSLPSYPGGLTSFKQFATGLSNEYGADLNRTVTPLLEQIGRQSADLTPAGREQIARQSLRFEQLTGGPAGGFANVLDSIMDVDPSVSSTQAGNLVEFLRSRGGLDIGTQQQVLGTLLPTAKMAGIGTDEVAGLSAMLSGMGGPEGQLAKGGRGILNRLDVLKKGGYITGTGGLFGAFTELDRLRSRQPDAFDQAMGEVSSAAGPVLSAVLTNRTDYEANVAAARAALSGGDALGDQFRGRLGSDAEFKLSVQSAQARARIENAPLGATVAAQRGQVGVLGTRAAIVENQQRLRNQGALGSLVANFESLIGYSTWGPYVEELQTAEEFNAGYQLPEAFARPITQVLRSPAQAQADRDARGGDGTREAAQLLRAAAAALDRAGRTPTPRPAVPRGVGAPQ